MKPDIFFDNFEALAEAPNGVKMLRSLILQFAVRGKMVSSIPQDMKFNNANISKSKQMDFEPPYKIPSDWDWFLLEEVAEILDNMRDPISEQQRDTRIYGKSNDQLYPYYGATQQVGWIEDYIFDEELVLLGEDGVLFLDPYRPKAYLINGKSWVNNHAHVLKGIKIRNKFLCNYLNVYNFEGRITGTTRFKLNQSKMRTILVPVPPLEEQDIIIHKVDRLMSLCDELEARQQKKCESRAHLNSAALDRLLAARAPGEFAEGWRRISENFDLLYDAPENVGALRQAILQLAVNGKLVEQDEKDESAAVLFERIKEKKELLIKEKKIKKEHSFDNITEADIPFGLPKGWAWCRVGDIATIKGGKRLPNGTMLIKVPTNHIYIRVSDMKNGTIDDSDLHYITNEVYEKIKNYIIEKDDLYLTIVGSTIGKLGIVPDKFHKMNLTENAARIIIYEVDRLYINYAMNSQFIQKQFFDKTKQLGQPKLALNRIVSTFFPLPPLAEQHRIVARVDQLMSLCDELEAGLLRSQADSENLMEAVVGRMVAGGDNA